MYSLGTLFDSGIHVKIPCIKELNMMMMIIIIIIIHNLIKFHINYSLSRQVLTISKSTLIAPGLILWFKTKWGKSAASEADCSFPSSPEVNNTRNYTSTPAYDTS
jgi:hypothetical protein